MNKLGKYHSERPTPALADCLKATRMEILGMYRARAQDRCGVPFADAWDRVCDWLQEAPENNASQFAFWVELQRAIQAPDSLAVAIAYYVEARIADADGHTERCWAALTQTYYYLGMANSPETVVERATRAGMARGEAFDELRAKVIEWLGALDEKSFPSVQAAMDVICARVERFQPQKPAQNGRKAGRGRSQSAPKLLRHWSVADPGVRAAFERVVAGAIKRGRKKKDPAGFSPAGSSGVQKP